MWKSIINSVAMVAIMTVLTGIVYPMAMTGLAQALFPSQANGSIIRYNGQSVGSKLIGQNFTSDKYFHGRPSSAGSDGYEALSSSGSNLGPTNAKLKQSVQERLDKIIAENALDSGKTVPGDLVLASASGLDPHITPDAAYLQLKRVAAARGLQQKEVERLVESHIEGRQFGLLGEQCVNVLELNLALDGLK